MPPSGWHDNNAEEGKDVVRMTRGSRSRQVIAVLCCISMCLTGCGKSKVSYEEKKTQSGTTSTPGGQDTKTGSSTKDITKYPIAKTLGISQNWYEDSVDGVNCTQRVKAQIHVPNVSGLGTVTVREHYLTKAEKKQICGELFEEGSVEVNIARVPSKELYQHEVSRMEDVKSYRSEASQSGDDYWMDNEEKQINLELARKKQLAAKAKRMSRISKDPGDYRQNAYLGKVGETYGTITFQSNPKRNRNSWSYRVVDATGFVSQGADPSKDLEKSYEVRLNGRKLSHAIDWQAYRDQTEDSLFSGEYQEYIDSMNTLENQCRMSEDEAAGKALALCEKLGLSHMITTGVSSMVFSIADQNEDSGYRQEKNGYVVILGHEIEGAASSNLLWTDGNSIEDNLSDYRNGGDYPLEQVKVYLNDHGIVQVDCQGMMEELTASSVQSALSLKQIQETMRKDLSKVDTDRAHTVDWTSLSLEYQLIKDSRHKDQYMYLPVWILSPAEYQGYSDGEYQNNADQAICVNAIDGSKIDVLKQALMETTDYYDSYQDMASGDITNLY